MLDATPFVIRELIERGEIAESDARRAEEHAQAHGCGVDVALLELDLVAGSRLALARAKICEYPYVDLESFEIDINNAMLLPRSTAERLGAFPLFVVDGVATVAMDDPLNLQAIDQLRQLTKLDIDPVLCDVKKLESLIARAYSLASGPEGDAGAAGAEDELITGDEPVVQAVNQILMTAADIGASDVHLSPDESTLHLRLRVDGVLHAQQGPSLAMHGGMVQRLKVMAHLDLTETRRPQDGKFRFHHRGQAVDVRLSVVPTVHGENVVLRLLRPASRIGSVAELGMPEDLRTWFEDAIQRPHGMLLVTGPTGSGKTTTLYSALSQINAPSRNIITIEDPVEIRLPLIRQIQVAADLGLTFAAALRSILRQDPDVILVGEIRDEETARIAVQSALTGHLVMSTLHTNDATGTVARLRDFGVPPFAINAALLGVIAQRLVRRVCGSCCGEHPVSENDARLLKLPAGGRSGFVGPVGCPKCAGVGYKGRVGVFEALRLTPKVRRLIEADAPIGAVREAAVAEGMRSLLDDGLEKARAHQTTLEEIRRLVATLDDSEEPQAAETSAQAAESATPAERPALDAMIEDDGNELPPEPEKVPA